MCGISGLVHTDSSRPCSPEVIAAMRDIAWYRGPDDAGAFVDGPVGLGHRRLSIIDLGGGHQPMADATGRYQIVFNGEIYNYRELRQQLADKGCSFRTHSDTEVLLNLYADRGEDCVDALNGMFAFAIWDTKTRTLFIARDRVGKKPLYFAETPQAFVFGSEIKSLFASGLVSPRFREDALAEYLLFRQVAGSETLFTGVRSLPPGCRMTVHDGTVKISRYWSPRPPVERMAITHGEALEQLSSLLHDAVKLRLISDVPVGTFCSGGVDSSLVTAIAATFKGDAVNTFSIGFDDPDFDESAYAKMVSARYHTVHHELRVGNVEYSELFPQMVWHNDEPLDFANSVHIFALSKFAKPHVTVVLTGEGSDELFAGYPRYRIPEMARRYAYVPALLRRALSNLTGDHRVRKLERFAAYSAEDALLYNSSYLRPEVAKAAFPRMNGFSLAFRRECLSGSAALDSVSRASLLDQETFLVSILHRQDKMSMAAAIESRVPFLDYRLVEWANRLPVSLKVTGAGGKALVKELARTLLPAEVVDRRKSGFGVPLARWFREPDGMGARIAALPDSASADVFDREVLRRLVAEHRSGQHDHSELLWTALNVATWRDAFRC